VRGRRRILELNRNTAGARAAFLHVATVVSEVTGVAFGDLVQPDRHGRPNRRLNSPIGIARHFTVYLTVVGCGVRQGSLARALGRHRRRVLESCRAIEELRDKPQIDALLDRMEAML
jgi:hypothetical protein